MNIGLLMLGVAAWAAVGVLALAMAMWKEPVLGFLPIAAAVFGAWAVGEYVTERVWKD